MPSANNSLNSALLDEELFVQGENGLTILLYEPVLPPLGSILARELLARTDDIDLRINSVGGDVFEGLMIYDVLKQYQGKVTVHIDGLAASMASVISQVGDEILIAENASFMVHRMRGMVAGRPEEIQRWAEHAQALEQKSLDIMMQNSTLSEERVREMLNEQTFLTAEQAVEAGWATQVVGSSQLDESELEQSKQAQIQLWNSFAQPTPTGESLLARLTQSLGLTKSNNETNTTQSNTNDNDDMETKLIAQAMGLSPNASQDELLSQAKQLNEQVNSLKEERDEAVKAKDKLEQSLQELDEKAAKERAEALVASAVKEGKITEGNKAEWQKFAEQDHDATAKILSGMAARQSLAAQAQPETEQAPAQSFGKLKSYDERMAEIRDKS